ncbi:MAG: methyltransferase domain-containing protein [Deltaproteobacteria bacterium]|jgi:SAM-dependent methyltransferase|nr:methyltransferase domain-containing protein [Deltaproteobacteria bacterium]
MLPNLALFDETFKRGRRETQAEAREFWDQAALGYKKLQDEGVNDAVHEKIIQTIVQRTGLNSSHRVLDLGCGPGRHSRLLAKIAGSVTAFDLAPTMVKLAQEEATRQGLTIATEVLDWSEVDLKAQGWEGQFFLAFASRTPAISDLATLRKMCATVSQGFGVLVSSIELTNSLRDPVLKELGLNEPEKARAVRSAFLELSLLWLDGYFPEVTYFDQKWAAPRSLKGSIAKQTRFMEIIQPLSPEEKDRVAKTLTAMAKGDEVLEEIEAKTILIIWEIPPRITVGS